MTGHIDQLAEWYESAERITKTNLPNKGDTLISPYEAGGFGIELERDGWTPNIVTIGEPVRILARAPKPKPAWHDAVEVIAHTKGWGRRRVFTRHEGIGTDGNHIWLCGNLNYGSDDLIDPAPLIEAKVTDEMVERLEGHFLNTANMALPEGLARRMLTAALGLETE